MTDDTQQMTSYALNDPAKLLQPRLLLLEDDERLGQITKELLDDEYRVEWVTSGAQAKSRFAAGSFDAAIADRRLPDMDGLELVRSLRASGVTTPVLILTALGAVGDIVDGLDGGANDYLTKPFSFKELDARLRAMLRGYDAERGDSYGIGDWVFHAHTAMAESPQGDLVPLTAAEAALLKVMCDSPDHVFSRAELLGTAFRPDAVEGTVDTYVSYIRQKTTRDIILTVRGKGYVLGRPEE
jgi:DNA-binding response OmpR family regulator